MPRSPLVHRQLDLVLRVALAHYVPVLCHQRLNPIGTMDQLVPLVIGVFKRVALSGRAAVVMQAHRVDLVNLAGSFLYQLREKAAGPAHVARVRPGRDEIEFGSIGWRPGGEAPKFLGILFRQHVSPAAPRFVADAPITDVERLAFARSRAQVGERRQPGRRVTVLKPFEVGAHRQAADVGSNIGLRVGETAQLHELVRTEPVWLILLWPVFQLFVAFRHFVVSVGPEVDAARTFVARSDAVTPVILIGEAAAWPADYSRLDPADILDQLTADAVDVRHFRVFTNPDAVVDDATEVLDKMAIDVR